MGENSWTIIVDVIIALVTVVIVFFAVRKVNQMENELDDYHANDSTSIYYQPLIPSDTLIIE